MSFYYLVSNIGCYRPFSEIKRTGGLFSFILFTSLSLSFSSMAQQKEGGRRTGSQIVDDTTKNVYGPKTTLWTTEENIFFNKKTYNALDTTITNYHRWTYIQRLNNFYKDLGNVGTALSPIFPTFSSTIGVTSGFNSYNLYYETEEPKYFDTKSPYSRMFIVWGGNGRAMTRIEFSRNINSRWNFGFNYRPLLVDRQLLRQKGERQTISHYYDLYTTYKSKSDKYSLLLNYRRIRHRVAESGGADVAPDEPFIKYFSPQTGQKLVATGTEDLRNNIHLLHQYQLAKPFQIYHMVDLGKQINKFTNIKSQDPKDFYDSVAVTSADTISDKTTLKIFQNEVGIKGNAAFLFYNFYYKNRSYRYTNQKLEIDELTFKPVAVEHYVGGRIAFEIDSLTELSGNAEYLLDGNYRVEGQFKTPWLDASAKSLLVKPGLMQNSYSGGHDYWNNSFSNIFINQVQGFLKANLGPIMISPGATFSTYKNYVFFREIEPTSPSTQRVLPFQSSGSQSIFSPELRMTLQFLKHMYFRPQVIYTKFLQNDDEAFRIPQLFANAQLAYEGKIFKGNLAVQIGLDAHWKSAYRAMGYDPAIQQFYNQNITTVPSFLLADVFFVGKFRRGMFFVKYNNLVQRFTQSGYLPTPGYPGQRNIMDFGFDLLLFD